MRYFSLILFGLILACGAETPEYESTTEKADSTENGIIEYDLDEKRLDAIEFNNKLSLIQQNIYDQITDLFMSEPTQIAQNRENVLFDLELTSNDLKNMDIPEGGALFRKAVLDLLKFYQDELNGGFKEMLPVLEKEAEDRTKEEDYHLTDYDEQFAIDEADYFLIISEEQYNFSKANNFKMTDL